MVKEQFTHEELNEYLEDCAHHAECISYPELALEIREAMPHWTKEAKIEYIQEEEYELWDEDGKKVLA